MPDTHLKVAPSSGLDMGSGPCSEMGLEAEAVKVVLDCTERSGLALTEGPLGFGGKEPVGWRMVPDFAALAHTALVL